MVILNKLSYLHYKVYIELNEIMKETLTIIYRNIYIYIYLFNICTKTGTSLSTILYSYFGS